MINARERWIVKMISNVKKESGEDALDVKSFKFDAKTKNVMLLSNFKEKKKKKFLFKILC